MRDVEVVILAARAAQGDHLRDESRVGEVLRSASRIAMDDRGKMLCGKATTETAQVRPTDAEQVCGVLVAEVS